MLLKKLFTFQRPRFHRLDFIDVVLENKLLLLLTWDIAHATKIRIRPGKMVYRKASGAAICTLPAGTDRVNIKITNLWRSSTMSLPLKRVTIDEATLQFINKQLQVLQPFFLTPLGPALRSMGPYIIDLYPRLQLPAATPLLNISINHQQLTYYVP